MCAYRYGIDPQPVGESYVLTDDASRPFPMSGEELESPEITRLKRLK